MSQISRVSMLQPVKKTIHRVSRIKSFFFLVVFLITEPFDMASAFFAIKIDFGVHKPSRNRYNEKIVPTTTTTKRCLNCWNSNGHNTYRTTNQDNFRTIYSLLLFQYLVAHFCFVRFICLLEEAGDNSFLISDILNRYLLSFFHFDAIIFFRFTLLRECIMCGFNSSRIISIDFFPWITNHRMNRTNDVRCIPLQTKNSNQLFEKTIVSI